MAKLFLRPSGTTGTPQLVPSGAAAGWQCVDEVTPDDFTTFVYQYCAELGTGGTFIDLYTLQDAAAAVAGVINSVTIRYRGAVDSTGFAEQYLCGIRTGSTTNYLDSIRTSASMTTYTKAWTTNPRVGGAWTWAQVNALLLVAYINVDGDDINPAGAEITWMEIEVDYNPQVTPTVPSMVCSSLTPAVTATPDLVEVTPSTVAAASAALAPSVSRLLMPAVVECSAIALTPAVWRTVQPSVVTCTVAAATHLLLRLALPAAVGCSLETLSPALWRTVSPANLVLQLSPLDVTLSVHHLVSPSTLHLQLVLLAVLLPRHDVLPLSLWIVRDIPISLYVRRMLELEVER